MVELADTLDLGSSAKAWEFKSPYPHQTNIIRTRFRSEMGSDCFLIVFSLST